MIRQFAGIIPASGFVGRMKHFLKAKVLALLTVLYFNWPISTIICVYLLLVQLCLLLLFLWEVAPGDHVHTPWSFHEVIYFPIILYNATGNSVITGELPLKKLRVLCWTSLVPYAACMLTTSPCSFWGFLTSNPVIAQLCPLNADQHHHILLLLLVMWQNLRMQFL